MINVLFQTESHFPVKKKVIDAAVMQALAGRITHAAEVSVAVVGDRRMRQLNKQYRNLDETTDVLSFPINDPSAHMTQVFVDPPDKILRLGDVVVSFPQAVSEATEQNRMVDDVIVDLVRHGLDHLLGIHHPE